MTQPPKAFNQDDLLRVEKENFRRLRDKFLRFVRTPNLSFKKLTNRAVSVVDKRLWHHPTALGLPNHLMVEPTTACQLKCPLCPVGNGMLERPPRFIDLAVYRKAVDELARYLYQINFNGSGEPLLHPRILEMADYAAANRVFCDLYTNLQTIDGDLLDAMPASGLDRILISLDGSEKASYEAYRVAGDFDRITGNIDRLVRKRNATIGSKLVIDIQMVVMKGNEHQIEDVQRLAMKLGADSVTVKRTFLFAGTGDAEETVGYLTDNEALSLYRKPAVSRSEAGDPAEFRGRRERKTCQLLWSSSVLLCDGRVSPCCFDYHGWVILGDLHDQSFRSIWNGPAYRQFRTDVTRDWRKVKLCTSMIGGCPNMRFEPNDWMVKRPGTFKQERVRGDVPLP